MTWPRRTRTFHLDRFGRKLEESATEEVSFHLETRVEQLVARGWAPEEARAEALRQFGDPEVVAERCRRIDERGTRRRALAEIFSDSMMDVRFALRSLGRARGYTLVTVLSLAVGIGVNAMVLTAVHAVWVAPVPGVTGEDRVVDPVVVQEGMDEWAWAYPDFEAVRDAETPFESLAAWSEAEATVGSEEGPERVRVAYASADYFRVLGALPVRGRAFVPAEERDPGQPRVAVVSHDYWQSRLGGSADVLGRTLTLNRAPYTVVGVAPERFRGARVTLGSLDVWTPLAQHPEMGREESFVTDRGRLSVQVLGRLRPGATRSEAQAALQTVFARLASEHPETNANRTVRAASFGRFPAQNRVWDLIALAGLWGMLAVLLLIICGNLAGMALARSAEKEQEIGVRLALGSSRLRLFRHLMVEAVLLALVGGAVGTALAMLGMTTLTPSDLGIVAPGVAFEPSVWVAVLSLALALAAALVFGLSPALRFSRPELVSTLKDDTGGGARRVGRLQRVTASAQVGAAFGLLVVGALFLRSLSGADEDTLGFRPVGMLVTDFRAGSLSSGLLDLSREGYATLEEGGGAFLEGMLEAARSLPGVAAAAAGDGVPLDRIRSWGLAARADLASDGGGEVTADFTRVTEGYFEAIGTPVLQGRGFRPEDDGTSEPVAVITRSLAERLWPGEPPLGRQLLWRAGREEASSRTVVGVVERVASSRTSEDLPHVFVPVRQDWSPRILLVLRTDTDASEVAGTLREALRSLDPALPAPQLLRAETIVARATQEQRATAGLGGGLGLVILVLSAMGVYGVVSLAVTHRTREIGLRMALGATRREVLLRVLGDALRMSAPGMLVGALLAAGSAAAARSMLLGVSPLDPVSFLAAAGLLLAVVLLASLGPALRASGVQPLQALRKS